MNRVCVIVALVFCAGACSSTIELTRQGPQVPPRQPNCEFELFTTLPEGYAELGTIDVNQGPFGGKLHGTLDKFKTQIRPHVCKAGGDAAVAFANDHGLYMKATVLSRMEQSPPQRTPAPTAASPASGCSYDTQCKGDRICEAGRCVDPSPAPSAPSDAGANRSEDAGSTAAAPTE